MLATIGFFTQSIFEYTLKKILGNNNGRLGFGNDAIPAGDGSRSRIPISVKCEPTRQLSYPDFSLLFKGLNTTGRHNLTNRTIRLYQACRDRGG